MKLRSELKTFLVNNKCKIAHKVATIKLEEVENWLTEETSTKNVEIVKEHLKNLETLDGNFSNLGFWKLKQKLSPLTADPPMAKHDELGNIITAPEAIKNLYIRTYQERLRNRKMKPELMDVYFLKTELWMSRMSECQNRKTEAWNMEDLDAVLKSLKNNKSMDPIGMINEVFKAGCIGSDLKEALILLFKGVKANQYLPI